MPLTVQEWTLIETSILTVGMVGFAGWVWRTTDQIGKLKDATIESTKTAGEALKAAIEEKNAHIQRLQADTAPAIIKAYTETKIYADKITQDFAKASKDLEELKARVAQDGRVVGEIEHKSQQMGFFMGLIYSIAMMGRSASSIPAPYVSDGNILVGNFKQLVDTAIATDDTKRNAMKSIESTLSRRFGTSGDDFIDPHTGIVDGEL